MKNINYAVLFSNKEKLDISSKCSIQIIKLSIPGSTEINEKTVQSDESSNGVMVPADRWRNQFLILNVSLFLYFYSCGNCF